MASLHDRIEGVLLGTAAGDALGAPYEFQPPRGPELPVEMAGGGPWEPGEWTDDTAMAIAIAEVAATGADLREATAQDAIVARWHEWSLGAKDVGIQTRSVLTTTARQDISAANARAVAATLHERTGRTAGNGSLMRTAPVALAYLDDEDALVEAARAISDLTHFEPDAGDATVLWTCAIRHAVLTTELDIRIGLRHIDVDCREVWAKRIEQAEVSRPSDFANNGWVVAALQAAWSAIATTTTGPGTHRAEHLRRGLDAAVRAGNDTDTVAAIAGGLLGAAYGASAVPLEWRHLLHGWPGITARGLVGLATAIHRKGRPVHDPTYPGSRINTLADHPHDPHVLLGGVGVLRQLPAEVDAVVSLCRVADADVPAGMPHVEVRLIDNTDLDENPHLDFVLLDTVQVIETLRAQGRTVLVHCAEAYSRTPTVAALYGAGLRGTSADEALQDVLTALPNANPNPMFREALRRLGDAWQPRVKTTPREAADYGPIADSPWRISERWSADSHAAAIPPEAWQHHAPEPLAGEITRILLSRVGSLSLKIFSAVPQRLDALGSVENIADTGKHDAGDLNADLIEGGAGANRDEAACHVFDLADSAGLSELADIGDGDHPPAAIAFNVDVVGAHSRLLVFVSGLFGFFYGLVTGRSSMFPTL